jgi:hypothetical protein
MQPTTSMPPHVPISEALPSVMFGVCCYSNGEMADLNACVGVATG